MNHFNMSFQSCFNWEQFMTYFTLKRITLRMDITFVIAKTFTCKETFSTQITLKIFGGAMICQCVIIQILFC